VPLRKRREVHAADAALVSTPKELEAVREPPGELVKLIFDAAPQPTAAAEPPAMVLVPVRIIVTSLWVKVKPEVAAMEESSTVRCAFETEKPEPEPVRVRPSSEIAVAPHKICEPSTVTSARAHWVRGIYLYKKWSDGSKDGQFRVIPSVEGTTLDIILNHNFTIDTPGLSPEPS
jgi:hypothetical protein